MFLSMQQTESHLNDAMADVIATEFTNITKQNEKPTFIYEILFLLFLPTLNAA